MTDDNLEIGEEEMEGGEFAAMELVEHVKRLDATALELEVRDETGMWLVTVKWIGSGSGKPN